MGRSQSLPIHIIPIHIIQILPNPDRNLGSTSVRIKHSCLLFLSLNSIVRNIVRISYHTMKILKVPIPKSLARLFVRHMISQRLQTKLLWTKIEIEFCV